jgi:hypothetical protein
MTKVKSQNLVPNNPVVLKIYNPKICGSHVAFHLLVVSTYSEKYL